MKEFFVDKLNAENIRKHFFYLGCTMDQDESKLPVLTECSCVIVRDSRLDKASLCKGRRRFLCNECDFHYGRKSKLQEHIQMHQMERDNCYGYVCHQCHAILRSERGLYDHKRMTHDKAYERQCPYCSIAFVNTSSLNSHVLKCKSRPS